MKNESPKPKTRKPPNDRQYRQAEIDQAISFAPPIRPCKTCKWPVVMGYCCNYCGEVDP